MKRYIPREKLSKKARGLLDRRRRVTWLFCPVTRTVESKKIYHRKRKSRELHEEWIRGIFLSNAAEFCPVSPEKTKRRMEHLFARQSLNIEGEGVSPRQPRNSEKLRISGPTPLSRNVSPRQPRNSEEQAGGVRAQSQQDKTMCFPVNPAAGMVLFGSEIRSETGSMFCR